VVFGGVSLRVKELNPRGGSKKLLFRSFELPRTCRRRHCPLTIPMLSLNKIIAALAHPVIAPVQFRAAYSLPSGSAGIGQPIQLVRAQGQHFECAPWVHKACTLTREQFQREVEKELTGRETEPWEIVYFKLYKSQIPVIEQALETAALMLGSDRSRGYCLEMICADFLGGANLDNGDPDVLVRALTTSLKFLSQAQRQAFLTSLNGQVQ